MKFQIHHTNGPNNNRNPKITDSEYQIKINTHTRKSCHLSIFVLLNHFKF